MVQSSVARIYRHVVHNITYNLLTMKVAGKSDVTTTYY